MNSYDAIAEEPRRQQKYTWADLARDGSDTYQSVYIHCSHVLFLLASIVLFLPVIAVLDPLAGEFRGQWPAFLHEQASQTTKYAKGYWWLVPAAVIALGGTLAKRSGFLNKKLTGYVAYSWYFLFSVGAASIASAVLKFVIGRARPYLYNDLGVFHLNPFSLNTQKFFLPDASFASFPSGHATTIGAVWMALSLRWPPLRGPMLFIALWLALTRVILGVHYPSDIFAGLLLGGYVVLVFSLYFPVSRHPALR